MLIVRPRSVCRLGPALALPALLLTACNPIQDPWVSDPEMLQEQRDRSPEMNDRLRERAVIVQGAR